MQGWKDCWLKVVVPSHSKKRKVKIMGQIKLVTRYQKLAAQEKNAYVSRHRIFSKIPSAEVVQHASRASGIPEAIMGASFVAIATQIEELLLNGHSIELSGLGTMRMSVSCKAVENYDDVSSNNVHIRRILFTPCVALKSKMNMVNIVTDKEEAEAAGTAETGA